MEKIVVSPILLFLVASCVQANTPVTTGASVGLLNSQQELRLISATSSPLWRWLLLGAPSSKEVLKQCGAEPPPRIPLAPPFLSAGIDAIFGYVFSWANDELQALMKEYTKTYS